MIVAIFTFIVCALVNVRGKGFVRVIPFLIVLISGYILTAFMRLVDFTPIKEAAWFEISHFILPFNTSYFDSFKLYFGPEALAIIPVAIVTLSEHIGDHTVLSEICGRQFLKDPDLNKTLLWDGLAICIPASFRNNLRRKYRGCWDDTGRFYYRYPARCCHCHHHFPLREIHRTDFNYSYSRFRRNVYLYYTGPSLLMA